MQTNLERLKEIFKDMSEDGFDLTSNLKWGFYFFSVDRSGLLKVYEELKGDNYVLERLEETVESSWKLHLSKIDVLTAVQLHKRNITFNELANTCDVDVYDGWDVEKLRK